MAPDLPHVGGALDLPIPIAQLLSQAVGAAEQRAVVERAVLERVAEGQVAEERVAGEWIAAEQVVVKQAVEEHYLAFSRAF